MHLPLAIRFYNNEVRFVTSADPFLCSLYPQNGLDNTPENIAAVLEALRLLPEGDEYDPKPTLDLVVRFTGGYEMFTGIPAEEMPFCPEPYLTGGVVMVEEDHPLYEKICAAHTGENEVARVITLNGHPVKAFLLTGDGGFLNALLTVQDYRKVMNA